MNLKTIQALLCIALLIAGLLIAAIGLGDALFPLLTSMGLAYLLFPVVQKLEALKIKREIAVLSVFLLFLCLVTVTFVLIIPSIYQDARSFLSALPNNMMIALQKVEAFALQFDIELPLDKASIVGLVKTYASQFTKETLLGITNVLKALFSNAIKSLIAVLNIFLFPLFFFYIINDYENISKAIEKLIPRKMLKPVHDFGHQTNLILNGYIRGQLMVASILAILYALGLTSIGLQFGFLIGILTGFLSIFPYAGFTIGFLSAITVCLATNSSFMVLLSVVGIFIFIQLLESFIITPKLVGDKLGLSTLTTMLALIIGGNLAGFIGILLAIPIAASLKVVFKSLAAVYVKSKFYTSSKKIFENN